eukprot:scaffold9019_cov64-Phaeocystis_antarctica.AAC.2
MQFFRNKYIYCHIAVYFMSRRDYATLTTTLSLAQEVGKVITQVKSGERAMCGCGAHQESRASSLP